MKAPNIMIFREIINQLSWDDKNSFDQASFLTKDYPSHIHTCNIAQWNSLLVALFNNTKARSANQIISMQTLIICEIVLIRLLNFENKFQTSLLSIANQSWTARHFQER